MRGKELLEKMEYAAPEYIETAERMTRVRGKAYRWIAAVACIALVALGSAGLRLYTAPSVVQPVRQGAFAADAPAATAKTPMTDNSKNLFINSDINYCNNRT